MSLTTGRFVIGVVFPLLALVTFLVVRWRLDRLSKPKYPPLSPKPRDFDAPNQERE